MKNMAVLDESNVVVNVIICEDHEPEHEFLIAYGDSNPAFIGGDYVGGYFYPPQPFPSWQRNAGAWVCPVAYPTSEGRWQWNEEAQEWQD